MAYILPTVGSSGTFTFAAPFDKLDKLTTTEILYVESIRSLKELVASNEDPYKTIYLEVNMTATDFKEDLDADIPIVVLRKTNNLYAYVPADRILSAPTLTGVPYIGMTIAVKLGSLPKDIDLTLLRSTLEQDVYDVIGVKATTAVVLTSATIMVSETEDTKFSLLRENQSSVDKSYRTRYFETLEVNRKLQEQIDAQAAYILQTKQQTTTS